MHDKTKAREWYRARRRLGSDEAKEALARLDGSAAEAADSQ